MKGSGTCRICDRDTRSRATTLCDGCWELRLLLRVKRERALKLLAELDAAEAARKSSPSPLDSMGGSAERAGL
jgi:hypothetical protein